MLGYAGGFVGPLMIGCDARSRRRHVARSPGALAFLAVAVLMLLALAVFWLIRPRELAGDRGAASRASAPVLEPAGHGDGRPRALTALGGGAVSAPAGTGSWLMSLM